MQDGINSTMVRLKRDWDEQIPEEIIKYQFHYGSIKTPSSQSLARGKSILYQFHYGSIKTIISSVWRDLIKVEYQFHYGSIKT